MNIMAPPWKSSENEMLWINIKHIVPIKFDKTVIMMDKKFSGL